MVLCSHRCASAPGALRLHTGVCERVALKRWVEEGRKGRKEGEKKGEKGKRKRGREGEEPT